MTTEQQRRGNEPAAEPKITLENISKHFGRVVAVEDVSLTVYENEILGIVGDNGAGKTTLMGVISGIHPPTSGQMYLDGTPVKFTSPSGSRERGIETVYQDLALMDDLDIARNMYMGKFPSRFSIGPLTVIDWDETFEQANKMLEFFNQDLDPRTEVAFLSGGQRQLIAISRALTFDPDVLVLDEPTSALSVAGSELVHSTMERLRDEGHTQIVVSHSIEEIYRLVDRIAVMYQGKLVEIVDPSTTEKQVVTELIKSGTKN